MKKGRRNKPTKKSNLKRKILRKWLGPWSDRPKTQEEKQGLRLARESLKITSSGSLVSPVALAVIDVLGMSEMLKNKPLEKIADETAFIFFDLDGEFYNFGSVPLTEGQLRRMGFRKSVGQFATMLSDTIVLARRPTWEVGNNKIAAADAIIRLAEYVSKITAINALNNIWVRSAISYGECLIWTANSQIFLGAPIREAFYWEKQQEWSGGMLAPSAIEKLKKGDQEARKLNGSDFEPPYPDWLVNYDIPLKPNSDVNPPDYLIALNWRSGRALKALDFLEFSEPKPDKNSTAKVKRKIHNTAKFFNTFDSISLMEPLPEQYQLRFSERN